MKKNILILVCISLILIFIIGCAEEEKPIPKETTEEEIQPIAEPKQTEEAGYEEGIEQIPESELQELCAKESWPPEGCSVIADSEGKLLCEKCQELTGIDVQKEVEEEIEGIIKEEDVTLLASLEHATDPDWSPDGTQIVFWGRKGTKEGLYLINSDGTGLRFLVPGSEPSWSPVDNRIMFPIKDILYLIDLDGNLEDKTKLVGWTTGQASWSPDGKRIAYSVFDESESSSIWIMDSDGSGKTKLTTDKEGFCRAPAFSYDGSKIAYLRGVTSYAGGPKPDKKANEIWVMNSDGSDKHMIFAPGDSVQLIFQSAWSKNNKILFFRDWLAEQTPHIWAINSDGTGLGCVLSPPNRIDAAFYGDPAWDNTGTKIAVNRESAQGGLQDIVTFLWKE